MHVLITGGAGFIGSHLAERCLAEGWHVAVLDDLSTGAAANIAHLKARAAFSYRIDSVFNEPVVAEMIDCADVVFHLAAAVGVKLIVDSPVRTIETNVDGTQIVLRHAAKKGRQVLLASTSEVYGKSTSLPFREGDDLVLGPTGIGRWSYAASKALDEWLALAYWRERDLPVTVLRFFNTVGPRQSGRYGMVLPTFVGQAMRGEPLTIHETGRQRRCFSYVGDVVEALVRLAQTPAAIGEVVNIGNDQEVTINELAELVLEITGSPSRLEYVSYADAYGAGFEDIPRRVPCLDKLYSLIHYRPHTPLETIVRRVLDYEWVQQRRRAASQAA
ncbi:MAG TPA: NAD-dependent epimerase/dehydratase family protein [Bryobacteraceae bacterium]|nr:NAD-dependent epimerase/dehydratase family protein [Bryobacteraceae bacterium]